MAILNKAHLNSKIVNPQGTQLVISTDSNTHRTNNIATDITVQKTSQQSFVLPKDRFLVTTTITNNTDIDISQIKFKDFLTTGATVVDGTLKIGTELHPEFNPLDSFDLPVTLGGSGASMLVTYEILIDDYLDVSQITNYTELTVIVDNKEFLITSNKQQINVLDNEITLLKTADTTIVKPGDTLTYTVTITNEGNITNTNLYFIDPAPSGTTFVEGSVKINGVQKAGLNPSGFDLQDLKAGETITVDFDVTIDE